MNKTVVTYNIYCDESCHLEHDDINVMVLGAIWCSQSKLHDINQRIKQIKARNGISLTAELKWTKVSSAKLDLYEDLINYYFDDDDLHFRALIVPDKSKLDHERFGHCNSCDGIKVWSVPYKSTTRVHLLLEEERYIVVLERRKSYCLLITAFYFEHDHSLKAKIKHYEKYKSA